jgi:hypothetical protein
MKKELTSQQDKPSRRLTADSKSKRERGEHSREEVGRVVVGTLHGAVALIVFSVRSHVRAEGERGVERDQAILSLEREGSNRQEGHDRDADHADETHTHLDRKHSCIAESEERA